MRRNIHDVTTKMLEIDGIPKAIRLCLEDVRKQMTYKAPEQDRDAWVAVAVSLYNQYGNAGPEDKAGKRLCEIFTLRKAK